MRRGEGSTPPGPRLLTEELGGSPLAAATLAGTVPPTWSVERPQGPSAWRARVGELRREFADGRWLSRLEGAFGESPAVADSLATLQRAGGVVVTTGQQPGLFGGPLYTLFKALSARELASTLAAVTGLPTLPVFWAATDDSDFGEARGATFVVDGRLQTATIEQQASDDTSMSAAPLGPVDDAYRVLEHACGSAPESSVLDVVRAAYAPDRTVGGAYVQLLRALLEPLGIPVLDASHLSVRNAARPDLLSALEHAPQIAEQLQQRSKEIRALGFEPQVADVADRTLVFSTIHGERHRIGIAERASVLAGAALSPNVLLRPVVERRILPTVAYVAGPGELAYFAQVSAVADTLQLPRPLGVPRWSGTIVEPRVDATLARIGLAVEELRQPGLAETRVAQAALPRSVSEAFEELRRSLDASLSKLAASDTRLVPPTAVQGARAWIHFRLERLERRYRAAIKREHADLMADIAAARAMIFPSQERQERVLNFIPFVARYGPALLEEVRDHARRHAERLVGSPPPFPVVDRDQMTLRA